MDYGLTLEDHKWILRLLEKSGNFAQIYINVASHFDGFQMRIIPYTRDQMVEAVEKGQGEEIEYFKLNIPCARTPVGDC